MERSIETIQNLYELPSAPEVALVYSDEFLPDISVRSF